MNSNMNAVDLELDYFQIYDLKQAVDLSGRRLSRRTAALRGQFDEEAQTRVLTWLIRFADRVSKNGETLFDKNAHLTGYTFARPLNFRPPLRRVWVANQFTQKEGQELQIVDIPVGLWVPAQKRILPDGEWSAKSTTLHHYMVYVVRRAQRVNYPSIRLKDQLIKRKARPLRPVAFAVPVWKKRKPGWQVEPMPDGVPGAAHLTIYLVEASENLSNEVATQDQFYTFDSLTLGWTERLAVPSKKLHSEKG